MHSTPLLSVADGTRPAMASFFSVLVLEVERRMLGCGYSYSEGSAKH